MYKINIDCNSQMFNSNPPLINTFFRKVCQWLCWLVPHSLPRNPIQIGAPVADVIGPRIASLINDAGMRRAARSGYYVPATASNSRNEDNAP